MSGVFFPALTEPWATRRRRCTASTRPSSTSRRRSPEPTGPRVSQIPRPHFFPSSPCYPLSFGLSFSAAHLRADWLPMIGARQPSGLNNWSLLTAAYPTERRSKHDEAEAVLPQFFQRGPLPSSFLCTLLYYNWSYLTMVKDDRKQEIWKKSTVLTRII